MAREIRIGISGWRYPPWRGVFYPKDLPQRRELEFASRKVSTIEINGSFYSLQRPEYYQAWHDATPDGFVFSVKGSRYITHMKRLNDIEQPLANFLASGILCLGEKLGPFLWQFPPNMKFDEARFRHFFKLLPRTSRQASQIARRHDKIVKGRAALKSGTDFPMRHAVEIRHESFRCPLFIELLREFSIALVVADTAGKWPLMEDITSDFVYVRLHGDKILYVSGYTETALEFWASRASKWSKGGEPPDARRVCGKAAKQTGRDVFVYFDNDVKVRAPADAINLSKLLRITYP